MLIRNVGKTLESSEHGKLHMQQCANRMKDFASSKDYCSRIKYGIRGILELRTNGWQEVRRAAPKGEVSPLRARRSPTKVSFSPQVERY